MLLTLDQSWPSFSLASYPFLSFYVFGHRLLSRGPFQGVKAADKGFVVTSMGGGFGWKWRDWGFNMGGGSRDRQLC